MPLIYWIVSKGDRGVITSRKSFCHRLLCYCCSTVNWPCIRSSGCASRADSPTLFGLRSLRPAEAFRAPSADRDAVCTVPTGRYCQRALCGFCFDSWKGNRWIDKSKFWCFRLEIVLTVCIRMPAAAWRRATGASDTPRRRLACGNWFARTRALKRKLMGCPNGAGGRFYPWRWCFRVARRQALWAHSALVDLDRLVVGLLPPRHTAAEIFLESLWHLLVSHHLVWLVAHETLCCWAGGGRSGYKTKINGNDSFLP